MISAPPSEAFDWDVLQTIEWIVFRGRPPVVFRHKSDETGWSTFEVFRALEARAKGDPRSWRPPTERKGYAPAWMTRALARRWIRAEGLTARDMLLKVGDPNAQWISMADADEVERLNTKALADLNDAVRRERIVAWARPSKSWQNTGNATPRQPLPSNVIDETRSIDRTGSLERHGGESGFDGLHDKGPFYHDTRFRTADVKRLWRISEGGPHFSERSTKETAASQPFYPPVGELPDSEYMSPCEALCWIGYGRAIPKDVYFSPIGKSRPSEIWYEEAVRLLHASIPEPKPLEDPMEGAEQRLIQAVRYGRVKAISVEDNHVLTPEDVALAVKITARNSLEADNKAPGVDVTMANRAARRELRLLTADIRAEWPPAGLAIQASTEILGQNGKVAPHKRASKHDLRRWYLNRVKTWPEDQTYPSEARDVADAKVAFPGATRQPIRDLRIELAPAEWKEKGRRSSK